MKTFESFRVFANYFQDYAFFVQTRKDLTLALINFLKYAKILHISQFTYGHFLKFSNILYAKRMHFRTFLKEFFQAPPLKNRGYAPDYKPQNSRHSSFRFYEIGNEIRCKNESSTKLHRI